MRLPTAAATLAATLLLAAPAFGANCPRTTLGDVEDEVMCPVCGTPLGLATEAPQANREREFIRRQIAACKSKDEIKSALAAEFGDEVLALPNDEGFDLLAYLVPALALVAGAGAVGFAVMRWRRRGTAGTGGSPASAPRDSPAAADRERLQEDLDRYDL